MKYQQRVQMAEKLIAAIESSDEPASENDQYLLRLVHLYRGRMADATNAEDARTALAALSYCWIDSGNWRSRFSPEIQKLLIPVPDNF